MARGLIDRFNSFVSKHHAQGCWDWVGNKHKQGYGKISFMGKATLAHRISYELFVGPIPKKMMVCHTCDNPSCVNPDHLFTGRAIDNMHDKINKGRHKGASKGEDHHNSKLTDSDIQMIRESEKTQYELAQELGVSQSHICQIRRYQRWQHVA